MFYSIRSGKTRFFVKPNLMQLRGVRPFLSEKFDIIKHKNYKFLEDYDDRSFFDVEKYMKRQGKARLNKEFIITRL